LPENRRTSGRPASCAHGPPQLPCVASHAHACGNKHNQVSAQGSHRQIMPLAAGNTSCQPNSRATSVAPQPSAVQTVAQQLITLGTAWGLNVLSYQCCDPPVALSCLHSCLLLKILLLSKLQQQQATCVSLCRQHAHAATCTCTGLTLEVVHQKWMLPRE
jgi:hypothetical protein